MISFIDRLVRRLSVSRKLMLIYLLDLTAVIFVTSILIEEKYIAINFARKEIHGVAYIEAVRDNMLAIVRSHDGGSTVDPASGAALIQARETAFGGAMQTSDAAGRLLAVLAQLPGEDGSESANQLHHQAFSAARGLLTQIGDQSNLILDPDLDSYYTMSLTLLRFPELLEQLLHYELDAGDRTAGLIIKGRLAASLENIEADYKQAYAGNTDKSLQSSMQTSQKMLLDALGSLVTTNFQNSGEVSRQRGETLSALDGAWRAAALGLDQLLAKRVQVLFQRMWLHLGMAAGLLGLILLMVFYISRQIAQPLRSLAAVADRVQADNDYTLRAHWQSEDEIGHLVTGFNTMLERLDRERLVQQELAAQARAADAQRELIEAIPIPLLVTAIPDHRILHANAPALAWVDPRLSDPWATCIEQKARARFFQRLADEGAAHEFEARWEGPRGPGWALLSASRLQYQGVDAVLTTFSPINTLKRLEARLRIWASVFEATSEGIMVLDRDRTILLANAAMVRATGYRVDELLGRDPEFLRDQRTDAALQRQLMQDVSDNGYWQGEYSLQRKDGAVSPQWLAVNTVRDDQGNPSHVIALFVDITERKAQEERIRHLAHHDALTGLPNRILFNERLRMSLQQAERQKIRVALLFVDLDRFKNINDSLGHHVGDGLLQSVAARLGESIRIGDTVSRQGGDEFVVIINGVEDVQEVMQITENRLIRGILQPHEVGELTLHISCSVGIAMYPDDGKDIETLMRSADTAMYSAKAQGRNNFQFFSADMNRHASERLSTETHLRKALGNHEFELYLQPIVSAVNNQLRSVEALLRWRQPELGLIPPDRFIPVAEETGLIHDIGRWVIEEACRLHARLQRNGIHLPTIAVNVSAVQFRREDFIDSVASALADSGLPPAQLQIELTESLMMGDSSKALADLLRLKGVGVGLSMDDFGTGYSSLSYLHRFPIDKLKIDRSFVLDMIEDPADMAITRAIVSLGKTLGLTIVAEGVEHAEELKALVDMGCDEVQGYLFSRPLPEHEFVVWYRDFSAGVEQ